MAEQRPPGDGAYEPEDPETGQPLQEIVAELAGPPPPRFLEAIRERIHRRSVTNHVVDFAGKGVAQVVLQWILMLLELFSPSKNIKNEARDE